MVKNCLAESLEKRKDYLQFEKVEIQGIETFFAGATLAGFFFALNSTFP